MEPNTIDTHRHTCLQTDWSREDIGYLLLQQHCSCPLSKAPICCPDGWRLFVLGCEDLLIITDYKLLLGIFRKRDIASISNPQISGLKEKTLRYRFSIQHCPGKWHRGPDAVFRYPVQSKPFVACICQPTTNKELESSDAIEDEIQSVKVTNLHTLTTAPTTANTIIPSNDSVITIDQLTVAAHSDKKSQSLLSIIHEGFQPAKHNTHPSIREFWEVRHRLITSDGLALMGDRLVIPLHYQQQILRALHSAHQCVASMQARANQTVYWPGMNASIRNFKASCTTCSNIAPSQSKETINLSPPPQWPFQQICIDYFEISGHTYRS